MKLVVYQMPVTENLNTLFRRLEELFSQAPKDSLIVLPELFTTPYVLSAIREFVPKSKEVLEFIRHLCREYEVYCAAGSLPVLDQGKIYNRCVVYDPLGRSLGSYDKIHGLEVHARHDFDEKKLFSMGDHLLTFKVDGMRVGIVLCYDIRFPELARMYGDNIDLLIVPAAFNNEVGRKHWKTLLQARAIENEFYVAGVNPAREVFSTYSSYGNSMVFDPDGGLMNEPTSYEQAFLVELDPKRVRQIRRRSPYYKIREKIDYPSIYEHFSESQKMDSRLIEVEFTVVEIDPDQDQEED